MPLLLAYGSRKTLVQTLCGTMLLSGYLWAEQTADPPDVKALSKREIGTRLYLEQIQPLLEKNCLGCHSTTTKQAGLSLSSRQGLLKGGKHGPAVVPGNSKSSLLFGLITHSQQPAMPPQGQKLPAQATALVGLWIDLGAPYGLLDSDKDIAPTDESSGALAASRDDHFAKVRSILETKCLHCHGGKFRQAGLDLSGRERILQGSDEHTDVVVPGDPGASLLVKKVRHQHEPGMPYQGQQLSEDEIRNLVAWVDAGAPYSSELSTASAEELKSPLPGSDHWAYQAPTRPDPPQVENQAWLRNPIDTFLAAEHERLSLEPMPEAPKRTLLRRLYLDLTGLPPTPDQLRSFLEDRSDRAFEKVVDQLLESPHYGERWGRHWMDVWRYSDWYGLRGFGLVQNSQRHLWHWRDWIIESLNEDKSYDRMILEMLAGDELAPTDPKTVRATGYLVRNWFGPNRNAWLRETVEHAASGFLATTLKCARCHDHKTDPIAQEEYYRFRAFFERHDVRTDPLPGEPDILKAGMPRAFDSEPRAASRTGPAIFAETYRFIRGDEKNPDKTNPLSPAVPEILGTLGEKIEPVELPLESYLPSIRPFVHRDLLRQAQEEIETAEAESAEAKQQVVLAQLRASEESNPTTLKAGRETFEKEIKPIFDKHCIVCHGPNVARNDFRPLTFDLLLEGGTRGGPGIIPGKSSISSVIRRLRGDKQPRMPAEAPPLPRKVIDRIADWVDGLQPADPQLALRQAQEALEISDKKLAWRRENLPALEARLIADRARHADPPDPRAADYAEVARRAERSATLLKAEMNLLEAQQRVADALRVPPASGETLIKTREKRISVANARVKAAQQALGKGKNEYSPVGTLYPKTSTGRRTALARWITRRNNPLTARVAINHIWMRHFGEPIVATVENFGLSGKAPSHPELLDWLSVEFMEQGWSMKHIHRLMVTSNAYRMQSWTSRADHPNLVTDPDNRYLWRMNQRRMEAETVRDSMLLAAGELDPTIGGAELDHYTGQRSRRRSLYFTHTPNENMEFLKLFDQADADGCYRRHESIVPQQALALSNSEISYTLSHLLARKASARVGRNANDFVAASFERILGRAPSTEEKADSLEYLQRQANLLTGPKKLTRFEAAIPGEVPPSAEPWLRARESLVHVLFNRNEFVTIR